MLETRACLKNNDTYLWVKVEGIIKAGREIRLEKEFMIVIGEEEEEVLSSTFLAHGLVGLVEDPGIRKYIKCISGNHSSL